jgi:ketosteroid isomerase-like protein
MNKAMLHQKTAAALPYVTSYRSRPIGILLLAIAMTLALTAGARAGTEENSENFMQMHNVEIAFHEAGSTKNLELMLSLFTDDAVLIAKGKTYTGKEQIKGYWQAHPAFQPKNQWVGYTPAFRIHYSVQGDSAHLYFECLWVDAIANKIATHTNSDDTLVRVNGKWLIKQMKAAVVPGV